MLNPSTARIRADRAEQPDEDTPEEFKGIDEVIKKLKEKLGQTVQKDARGQKGKNYEQDGVNATPIGRGATRATRRSLFGAG